MNTLDEWSVTLDPNDSDRRAMLEEVSSPAVFAARLLKAASVSAEHVRLGWEESGDCPGHHRATLQVWAGEALFNQFFNGRSGYRAAFWQHYKCGLRMNNIIINEARRSIVGKMPKILTCVTLGIGGVAGDSVAVVRSTFLASLEPYVAKVWWCENLIQDERRIEQLLPSLTGGGRAGPKLWPTVEADDTKAWLEIKGRFLGLRRWEQGHKKRPILDRAKELQKTGAI